MDDLTGCRGTWQGTTSNPASGRQLGRLDLPPSVLPPPVGPRLRWSWSKCGRRWCPAGCAGRGRTASWRARPPSSPSWCGRCSGDSGSDMAAWSLTIESPEPPCCSYLKGELKGCYSVFHSKNSTTSLLDYLIYWLCWLCTGKKTLLCWE